MSTLLHNKDGERADTDRTKMQASDIVSTVTAAAASISMSANSFSFDTGKRISFYKRKNKQDNQTGDDNDVWDMVDNSYDTSHTVDIDALLGISFTDHSNNTNNNNKTMDSTTKKMNDEKNINDDFINIDAKGRMTADSLESDPRDGKMLIDNAFIQGSSRSSNLKNGNNNNNDIMLQENYIRSPDRISSPGDPIYDVRISDMYEVMNIPPSPTSSTDTHINPNNELSTASTTMVMMVNKSRRRSESSDDGKDNNDIQRKNTNDDNNDDERYASRKEIEINDNNNNSDEILALLKKLTYQLFGKTGDIIFMFIMESFCPKEYSMSYFLISHTLAMFLGAFIGRKVSKLSFPSSKFAYNFGATTSATNTARMSYNSINSSNNSNTSGFANDQDTFNDDPVSTM